LFVHGGVSRAGSEPAGVPNSEPIPDRAVNNKMQFRKMGRVGGQNCN
jgi:hypothetical protein